MAKGVLMPEVYLPEAGQPPPTRGAKSKELKANSSKRRKANDKGRSYARSLPAEAGQKFICRRQASSQEPL
jgi:hypothetical protein